MPSCFVIIGYGKKVSYANGKPRVLDLDETYTVLIKPVFDALNIPCYRAIDKNINGSIDKLMLQEIKDADIALVDITTLNANVMWELGVRHALKSKYTVVICEKEQMASIPFDINHFVVHQYTHSEEGIPYKEVERFRKYLGETIKKMLEQQSEENDSPVYTFLKDEMEKAGVIKAATANPVENAGAESFASIMKKAEEAKSKKEFESALEFLAAAKKMASENMTLKDSLTFIISRQALCTYKSQKPSEAEALINAKNILAALNPAQSQDTEVLGLSGAICKRLNDITGNMQYLDDAIMFYEKGFQLKQDYYNGINTAFMLYKKAGLMKKQNNEDWEDIKLKADYIRNSVLEISKKLESANDFLTTGDAVWVLLTMAEAYNYKRNDTKLKEYEEKATVLAEKNNDKFAMSSYMEQKAKIEKDIFQNLN
ncbi:hypothetical protein BH10BAC2_BH10BAC2_22520 [soil metagenome]